MNNFERIFDEIRKEAGNLAPEDEAKRESIVRSIMEIVELEDRHSLRSIPRINIKVKTIIEDATRDGQPKEST